MVKSIRWRLQIWYSLVLIAVVSIFAGILYLQARASAFREVDSRLEAAIRYLTGELHQYLPPPPDFEKHNRPLPKRKSDKEDFGRAFGRRFPVESFDSLRIPYDPEGMTPWGRSKFYFGIWNHDGAPEKTVDLPENTSIPDVPSASEGPITVFRQRDGSREAAMMGPQFTRILVGVSTVQEEKSLRVFAIQLAGAGLAVLTIGLFGGWLISARIFRPITAMSKTAATISAANLSQRIDADIVDNELAGLARILNAMFERLQEAFERQARFTADASHELRTPLAIIRSHSQLSLERPRSSDEYRQTIQSCMRAADRMAALVEGLLILARADAGWPSWNKQKIELGAMVAEAIVMFRPLAQAKQVTITMELTEVYIKADPSALGQLISNFLGNAIQYNRENGSLHVKLVAADFEVTFSVADTGCGIPDEDQPHVFERFYRVDKARARATGGTGLGLSICKSIVEGHGGTIGFESKVDVGSTFWAKLPLVGAETRQ